MGEDAGESSTSSVIKETIVDVMKLKQAVEAEESASSEKVGDFTRLKDVEGFDQRYVDILRCSFEDLKDRDSWDEDVHPGAYFGFYRVPEGMRRRAGSEEEDLYEPKYINFSKIKDLFKENDLGVNVDTQSQLRHYCYHLRSYADRKGKKIGDLMREFNESLEELSRVRKEPVIPTNSTITFPDIMALLLGSCFLNDLFYKSFKGIKPGWKDQECAHLWVSELWADLLLLENQIVNFTEPSVGGVYLYFRNFLPLNQVPQLLLASAETGLIFNQHILKSVHNMLLPEPTNGLYFTSLTAFYLNVLGRKRKSEESWTMRPVPTATRLQQAGIKFKPAAEEGFVVEFKRGVLKLPYLHITKSTKKVLMNLIAWEKCDIGASKYIINFAIFMDYLINTSKDVEVLVRSRVLEHSLSDEEVTALFNGLGQDLVYTKDRPEYDIFPNLCIKLNDYCQSWQNKLWANLMQDYCKSPWKFISVVAASFLILLTATQTFFSAYSYFRPPK